MGGYLFFVLFCTKFLGVGRALLGRRRLVGGGIGGKGAWGDRAGGGKKGRMCSHCRCSWIGCVAVEREWYVSNIIWPNRSLDSWMYASGAQYFSRVMLVASFPSWWLISTCGSGLGCRDWRGRPRATAEAMHARCAICSDGVRSIFSIGSRAGMGKIASSDIDKVSKKRFNFCVEFFHTCKSRRIFGHSSTQHDDDRHLR
jgi:hypothetical protein